MFNSHIHTNFSHDCKVSMEDMCLAAIDAGFSGVTFADHCNADSLISGNAFSCVTKSVNEAYRLSEKYKDSLTVSAGVEISDAHRKPDYMARLIKSLRPDCVIASVHNIFFNNMPRNLSRIDFGSMTDAEAYKIVKVYFQELVTVASSTDYDVLAHLTLPLRYTNGVYGKKLVLDDFSKEIETILKSLIKRGKALELNTSEVNHQLFDFMPCESIIRKYFGLGGRLITIGTDAHKSDGISTGFMEGKKLIKEIGFDSYCYYKNRRPVKIML